MHLTLNVDYKELESMVKQLPVSDLKRLNTAINHEIDAKKLSQRSNMQTLTLKAPTWTDSEYSNHLAIRKHSNNSRLL